MFQHILFGHFLSVQSLLYKLDLNQEWCGLLDPTDEYDVSLIAFGIDGKVYPACTDADCWDAIRVHLSIRVF